MAHSTVALAAACLLAGLRGANAAAQDQPFTKSDLPGAVRKAAEEQGKGAVVRGYSSKTEGGQLEYEIALTIHGRSRDVSIAADGGIIAIEEQVALDSVPAAVREGLYIKAGAGQITNVESITKHGTIVAYEAQLRTGSKRSEVQVGPDGKPLDHEE
jgi:hypothetical protein